MVRITRREFMKYCSVAAGALGLSASTLMKLENAMARETANGGQAVIWLDGAACTGCSMTLLNSRFYTTVDDLLVNRLDLEYHKTVMTAAGAYVNGNPYAGANSVAKAQAAYAAGGYVLVVEGAVQAGNPLGGNDGEFCLVGKLTGGSYETMLENTRRLAANAAAILAVGTCASFGGIPNGRGSITDAKGLLYQGTTFGKGALNDPALENVGGVTNAVLATKPVINIPGCPPHPDWIVGTIAHILDTAVTFPALTSYRRPLDYGYGEYQCNAGPCPWRYNNTATRAKNTDPQNGPYSPEPEWNARYPQGDSKALGKNKWAGIDVGCLGILGCKGRKTKADCSRRRWNTDVAEEYGVNWCVGSRGNCHGCTEPTFPDKVGKFYTFV